VARAIHAASPRRYMPMVTIHCGALTETLLESELFGHEKGRVHRRAVPQEGQVRSGRRRHGVSGRDQRHQPATQTDLLRVLQEKEIVRVGGNQPIKVDFRCIAATNKNLEDW
jgi:two-component system, NtrC family, response regulator HydG